MPRLVHLAREADARAIERAGIRARVTAIPIERGRSIELRAVYAMPVMPDFAATYQWLRELRRWHGQRMVAVHFVGASDELAFVGRYDAPHERLPLGDAIRHLRAAPLGAELILPRSVRAREVVAIRQTTQLVGWTEVAPPRVAIDCLCQACVGPGTRDLMHRVRAAWERQILAARRAKTPDEAVAALAKLEVPLERARGRVSPKKLLAFVRADAVEVRRVAVGLLGYFRFADVEAVLAARLTDEYGSVREVAVDSLVRAGGARRAWNRIARANDDLVTAKLVEHLGFATDATAAATILQSIAHTASPRARRAVKVAASELLRDDELTAPTRRTLTELVAVRETPTSG